MREVVVGCHQPNLFPWVGYFHKVVNCTHFVTLVCAQFEKGGFQNRTRIRTADGWQWLTVPVLTKGKSPQMISEVQINNAASWRAKHLRSLEQHYRKAKYFEEYWPAYEKLYSDDWHYLSAFNQAGIMLMLRQLGVSGMDTRFHTDWEFPLEGDSTAKILSICKCLRADSYLSGQSGEKYMDLERFDNTNISFSIQVVDETVRDQVYYPFEPFMSTLDLIFNLGPWARAYLRTCGDFRWLRN